MLRMSIDCLSDSVALESWQTAVFVYNGLLLCSIFSFLTVVYWHQRFFSNFRIECKECQNLSCHLKVLYIYTNFVTVRCQPRVEPSVFWMRIGRVTCSVVGAPKQNTTFLKFVKLFSTWSTLSTKNSIYVRYLDLIMYQLISKWNFGFRPSLCLKVTSAPPKLWPHL
jgi:hypothetical protein